MTGKKERAEAMRQDKTHNLAAIESLYTMIKYGRDGGAGNRSKRKCVFCRSELDAGNFGQVCLSRSCKAKAAKKRFFDPFSGPAPTLESVDQIKMTDVDAQILLSGSETIMIGRSKLIRPKNEYTRKLSSIVASRDHQFCRRLMELSINRLRTQFPKEAAADDAFQSLNSEQQQYSRKGALAAHRLWNLGLLAVGPKKNGWVPGRRTVLGDQYVERHQEELEELARDAPEIAVQITNQKAAWLLACRQIDE